MNSLIHKALRKSKFSYWESAMETRYHDLNTLRGCCMLVLQSYGNMFGLGKPKTIKWVTVGVINLTAKQH